jgi:hypothetical protein
MAPLRTSRESSTAHVLKGAVAVPEKLLQLDVAAAAGAANGQQARIAMALNRPWRMHLTRKVSFIVSEHLDDATTSEKLKYYARKVIKSKFESSVCERMLERGCQVLCVDNFFTGTRHHIEHLLDHKCLSCYGTISLFIEVRPS